MVTTCAQCKAETAPWLCQLCGIRFCRECIETLPKREHYEKLLHVHAAIGRVCSCGGSVWLFLEVWHA